MVMNPKVVNYGSMFANRLEPEIYSLEMLRDVVREARKNGMKDYPIHLKLDTGMHRMGCCLSNSWRRPPSDMRSRRREAVVDVFASGHS